jgi:hypothetical protein
MSLPTFIIQDKTAVSHDLISGLFEKSYNSNTFQTETQGKFPEIIHHLRSL